MRDSFEFPGIQHFFSEVIDDDSFQYNWLWLTGLCQACPSHDVIASQYPEVLVSELCHGNNQKVILDEHLTVSAFDKRNTCMRQIHETVFFGGPPLPSVALKHVFKIAQCSLHLECWCNRRTFGPYCWKFLSFRTHTKPVMPYKQAALCSPIWHAPTPSDLTFEWSLDCSSNGRAQDSYPMHRSQIQVHWKGGSYPTSMIAFPVRTYCCL